MANEGHLKILKKGVEAWNRWRKENAAITPDLSEAHLRGEHLRGVTLYGANLRAADLFEADLNGARLNWAEFSRANLRKATLREVHLNNAKLSGADLFKADLSGADLSQADLIGANLREATLREATLRGAHLHRADFREADLGGADFSKAIVSYTIFGLIDLSTVKGIETIEHQGPSTIGIEAIYRSQGKIPEIFLRGAGVPDNFIEYMHSLVGSAFEFYSCFISYSGHDQEFADRIYEGLQNNGVRCWFAPHHVQAGKKLHEQIDDAIRLHERLLLILSANSIKSEWVKTEISKARKREIREGRRVLFPISLNIPYQELQDWECFDADAGKDSAREIREYYIPDFSRWKDHDSFQEEFKKLLRDLKKPDAARAEAGA